MKTQYDLITKLESFLYLKENWDGYGGIKPLKEDIEIVINFIKEIPFEYLPHDIGLAGDGEINLYWKAKDFYAEFGYFQNSFCYFIKDKNKKYLKDDIKYFSEVPTEIQNLLSRKYHGW